MFKREKKKKVIITVLSAIALAGSLYLMSRPPKLMASRAVSGSITGTVKESGTICGQENRKYYALVSAPVKGFDLKEGDTVKQGDTLLTYDLSRLEYRSREATINRQMSEAQCEGTIKKSDENKKRYEQAKIDDAMYSALYATVRADEQNLTEGQYAVDYERQCAIDGINKRIAEKNQEILDKTQELSRQLEKEEKYTAREEEAPRKVTKKRKELRDELNDLNDELAQLKTEAAGIRGEGLSPGDNERINEDSNNMEDISRLWEQAIEKKQSYEASYLNEEEKDALYRQTDAARENEEQAQWELSRGEGGVKALSDGVVTSCSVKEDAYVQEGQELFSIESTDSVKAKVEISRFDIGSIEYGQEALVEVADSSFRGFVTYISSRAVNDESDKSRIEVEITLEEPDDRLILGVDADVTIFTKQADDAVLLPADSYYADDGGSYVFLIKDGRVEKRYFEPGIVNDEYVQCLSGIAVGEVLITDAVTDELAGKRAEAVFLRE